MDLQDKAVIETATRFIRGTVPNQNVTFAPSVAEFVRAARWQEEFISARDRPRLPASAPANHHESLAPFEIGRNKLLAANAHLSVLHENVSLDDFTVSTSVAIGLTTATPAVLSFNSEIRNDCGDFHSTSANTGRLTVPAGVRRVRLTANVQFLAGAPAIGRFGSGKTAQVMLLVHRSRPPLRRIRHI
jgi:hypothetical protein